MSSDTAATEVRDTMGMTVHHEGEEYPITDDATAEDLKQDIGVGEDRRLSFRDGDRTEVLNDDDVVADRVEDGTEITTVPLNDGRTFG